MIWHEANYDGLVQLRYSFRLYPTPGQCIALAKAFGCARVVFNDALAARQAAYVARLPYVTDAALSARLTAAKATPERAWLSEVSAVVLQQAQADLNAAYRNFFASRTGARKGPKISLPRFRSGKDRRQTIRFTRNARFAVTPGGKPGRAVHVDHRAVPGHGGPAAGPSRALNAGPWRVYSDLQPSHGSRA